MPIGPAKRRRIYDKFGWRCVACGWQVPEDRRTLHQQSQEGCAHTQRLTLDHIQPRKLGGTDAESNLQPMCYSCNTRKGAAVLLPGKPIPRPVPIDELRAKVQKVFAIRKAEAGQRARLLSRPPWLPEAVWWWWLSQLVEIEVAVQPVDVGMPPQEADE